MASIRNMTEEEVKEYEETVKGAKQLSLSDLFNDVSIKQDFERIDLNIPADDETTRIANKNTELSFKLNHILPRSEEYMEILNELFKDRIGQNSFVMAPLNGVWFNNITIGNNVYINANLLAMARGGIIIEDDVQIAGNVQLLTNNHDEYNRSVLLCKPIVIKKGAWIGAGATILPGVTIGEHAIVGAASVVTKDVADCEVVVGSPAKVIKVLDADRFG